MTESQVVTVPLHTVADVIDPHPSHRAPSRVNVGIPFVGIGDLSNFTDLSFQNARTVSRDVFEEHAARYDLQEGLLGLGRVASVGLVVDLPIPSNDNPYVVSPTLAVIKPKQIDKSFLKYQLMAPHVQLQLDSMKQGSGRESVGVQKLRNVLIFLPPLDEQKHIVETLDDHLSRLDKAVAELDHADAQMHVMRRSIFNELLTRQVPDSEPGTKRMTQVPSNRICKLGDVVTFTGGFSFKSSAWKTTGVPVIKIANVRHGKVTLDGCSFVDEASAKESAAYKVQKHDLLMTLTGEIGAMGFYKETFEARLNQRLCKVSVKKSEDLSLQYVHYFLTSPAVRQVMWQMSKGAAQANISVKDIAGIQIPMPPLQEQQRIVEALDDYLSRLDATRTSIASQRASIQALRTSLLNKAFNGELGTR